MYDYKKLKKSKLVKMKKDGTRFYLSVTRFDQQTGEKREPIVFNLEKGRLEADKTKHEEEAADIAEILKDMKTWGGKRNENRL